MTIPTVVTESVQGRTDPEQQTFPVYLPLLMQFVDQTDELNAWWTPFRDVDLRRFWKKDGLFALAISSYKSVTSTTGFVIEGEKPGLVKRSTELINNAEFGQGFKVMLKKLAEDWLTQDNGMFMEIIAPGSKSDAITSPPLGVAHLDAGRCWRSLDIEHPVWYQDPKTSEWIKLHWTRVAYQSSNPSPLEAARGVGFCAVSGAASIMATMRDTVRYKLEKISGRHTRAIMTVSGAPAKAVELAIEEAGRASDNAGNTKFSAIPIIAAPSQEGIDINVNVVELAGVPDGFDWQTELTMYMYIIALALGVDARELWPATSSGATKADAEIQHRKAMRKGMGDFLTTIAYWINHRVFPPGVSFEFKPADSEEDSVQASIEDTRVKSAETMVNTGVVTPRGALLWLVNNGVLSPEYLENPDLSSTAEEQYEPESAPEPMASDEAEKPEETESDDEPTMQDEGGKSGANRVPFGGGLKQWALDRRRENLWRRIVQPYARQLEDYGLVSSTPPNSSTPSIPPSDSD